MFGVIVGRVPNSQEVTLILRNKELAEDLIDIHLLAEGFVVAIGQVFIDESGTHDGSPCISVGGVIFKKNKAKEFSKKWAFQLRRRGLEYFRMSECTHQQGQFLGKSSDECLDAELSLLKLIYQFAEAGFGLSFSEKDFERTYEGVRDGIEWKHLSGEAYSRLIHESLVYAGGWAKRANFQGRLAYFFEAGHRHQNAAHRRVEEVVHPSPDLFGIDMEAVAREMGKIFGLSESAHQAYRYLSHAFVDKREFAPLQAADLIAWLWRNTAIRQMNGKEPRKDWEALESNLPMKYQHWDIEDLIRRRVTTDALLRTLGI